MSKNAIIDTPRLTHLVVSYVKCKGRDYFLIKQVFIKKIPIMIRISIRNTNYLTHPTSKPSKNYVARKHSSTPRTRQTTVQYPHL